MNEINIGGKMLTDSSETLIIAEAGINHDGNIDTAVELVRAAKRSGADVVKFQSFKADKICDVDLEEIKKVEGITGGSKSSYLMYKNLELSDEDHYVLQKVAKEEGIMFSSSVFDFETVDFLDSLEIPFFKISSGDVTFLPLVRKVAETGKPIIISTGMATLTEVLEACDVCRDAGNDNVVLLHCNSDYPPKPDEINLRAMDVMRKASNFLVGFSDHSKGYNVSLAAATLGAAVVEKHFTLDNNADGPDHQLSLNPADFKKMVQGIREIKTALGSDVKEPTPTEKGNIFSGRRSILAARDIAAGESISFKDIKMIKPAKGIATKYLEFVLGRKVNQDIKKYEPITWDVI